MSYQSLAAKIKREKNLRPYFQIFPDLLVVEFCSIEIFVPKRGGVFYNGRVASCELQVAGGKWQVGKFSSVRRGFA